MFPIEYRKPLSLISFATRVVSLHPILTFRAGSNELSPSQLTPPPPLHSHMVIYIQNIFLS